MSPEAVLTVDTKASSCVLRSLALIKYTFRRWEDLRTQLFAFPRKGNEHDAYQFDEDGFCRRPVKCGNSGRGKRAHETSEYAHYEWHSHLDHCEFAHRTHSVT